MTSTVEHNEGEDFGSLVVTLGRDDDARVDVGEGRITLPLFAYQARELIEVLTPLANTEDAT